ncbi:hypothetical protein C5167_013910 [Papaver somniferum]|uniref:Transcription initiation factor IIE subunit alpha N-terminal domain-containing protein n=1 Tax=Papaver somniferum TaxID=3469 RepID=A0A4Y7J4S3_PAPSO|nr:hypothetical protein C5167_013910 [Papaver somniferum]
MKKKLKAELDYVNTVQEYLCPGCKKRYNALDALHLISSTGEGFHCENCDGKLVAEGDDLAAKKLRDMLKRKDETTAETIGGTTQECRAQVTIEEKVDRGATSADLKIGEEEEKDIQAEYYKAYYEALMKRQQEAAKMNQQEPTSSGNEI